MPRPTSRQPTDGELEILKVLWDQGPCDLGTVCEALRRHREVATTTVATMLKVMLDKALVKRASGARSYLWSARVSRAATSRKLLRKLLTSAFDGSARGMIAHLVESGDLSLEDWEEIRGLLEGAQGKRSGKGRRKND